LSLQQVVSDLLTHTLGGLVHIEWQVEDGVWRAFADQAQLELALLNLIINARDAMPAGGAITIAVGNRQLGADEVSGLAAGDYVRFAISDTGTGISPDHLEMVTEPFFTTKEVGKGSGLGLSMVYGFARQSNGAFRIESALGEGTTAELWLPRAPQGASREPAAAPEQRRTDSSRKLRILLVDDHAEVRSTTAAVLADLGHIVTEAANGTEALELLEHDRCRCDLMITDYAMPHLSGTDFLRSARELCPDVPALIITGYADTEAIGDRPEDVDILLKPFTPAALEGALARVCSETAPLR
jgi:CheY-like chemotaxis protein